MSDYLHEDTVFQILKWLPPESLWQFRRVCKTWKERIDSQSFVLDYLSSQKPHLIVQFDEDKHFLAFDPDELPDQGMMIRPIGHIPGRKFHLANTLHGIVCFYDEFSAQFALWNPCICKFAFPPVPKFKSFNWYEYDNEIYSTQGGFWIDPKTKEFKLVIFKLPLFEDDDVADVPHGGFYSSIQREWKEVSLEEIHSFHKGEVTPPVVIEEVAYWTVFYEYYDDAEEESMEESKIAVVVVFFDFAQERFGRIQALSVEEGWDLPVLCNWEGGGPSLVYLGPDKGCTIYIYSKDDDSWVRVFDMPVRSNVSRVLWGWGAGQLEDMSINIGILATTDSRELVLYDMKNLSLHVLEAGLKEGAHFATTFGFVDSLLFPSA